MRSQATALAYSIFDDMRANRTLALVGPPYAYAVAIGANPGPVVCPAPPVGCSPNQQAQNDLANWKAALLAALPAGDGSVTITTANDPNSGVANVVASVTVQWNDSVAQQVLGGPAGGNDTVVLETIL